MISPKDQVGLEIYGEPRHNDCRDMVVNFREDFGNVLAGDNRRSLGERYLKLGLEIHVHFLARINGFDAEPDYLCATFYKPSMNVNLGSHSGVAAVEGIESRAAEGGDGRMQEPVTVQAREFVELPQRVVGERGPSLVRLQVLDDCLRSWDDVSDAPVGSLAESALSNPGVSLPVHIPEDGKLALIRGCLGQRAAMSASQVEGQKVKAGTQVVQAVSNGNGEEAPVGHRNILYGDDVIAGASIKLMDQAVVLSLSPVDGLSFDFLQMLKRPR